ncbi:HD domain-containing protein [Verrucomicrobiota bacterium]
MIPPDGEKAATPDQSGPAPPGPVAVIEIGTTAIRAVVAQFGRGSRFRVLDPLQQTVSLGRDTFSTGLIEQETIEECVKVLRGFLDVLKQSGVTDDRRITAVATSAVREASNRDAFVDRILIATGIHVRVIDEAEVNRFTYHAVRPALQRQRFWKTSDTIVVEVGGGSTEALVFRRGKIGDSHMYRLGALRLRKMLEDYHAPRGRLRQIMRRHVDQMVSQVKAAIAPARSARMLALGGEARFACAHLNPDWSRKDTVSLPVSDLTRLTNEILGLSMDEVVGRYGVTYPDAETLGPALLIYARLAKTLGIENILVCGATLRTGVLAEMAMQGAWTSDLKKQIIASAVKIADKYGVERRHSQYVASMARRLFRILQDEHRLDPRFELLLTVAALLHEAGLYVSHNAHHKHSMYLMLNSDIFGLGSDDIVLAALVARYHRRAQPRPTHPYYAELDKNRKVTVSKLAAILRVADALDQEHTHRMGVPDMHIEEGSLVITCRKSGDFTLERHGLQGKAAPMFSQVYGMGIVFRTAHGRQANGRA